MRTASSRVLRAARLPAPPPVASPPPPSPTPAASAGRCVFYDEYADGSTCQGDIVQDWVRIGDLAVQGLFGCELASTGNIFMEYSDGIFGLGLGQASVFTQMVDAQVIDNEVRCAGRA